MNRSELEGLISFGMNPVANGPNSVKMLSALAKLKWMIVVENFETETASFWKANELAGRVLPRRAIAAADVDTEVFLLPAACFAEKDGTFVNSSRWLQWKNKALPPRRATRSPIKRSSRGCSLKLRELYQVKRAGQPPSLSPPFRLEVWKRSRRLTSRKSRAK